MSKCKYCGKEVENSSRVCSDCASDDCLCCEDECQCGSGHGCTSGCNCEVLDTDTYDDYDDRMDNEYR